MLQFAKETQISSATNIEGRRVEPNCVIRFFFNILVGASGTTTWEQAAKYYRSSSNTVQNILRHFDS